MIADLVTRLRAHSCDVSEYGQPIKPRVCHEAAARIEELETAAKRVVTFSVQSGYERATVQRVTEDLHRVLSAGEPHAADCEWFRVHNLPEAKRWMEAAWAAHPHKLLSDIRSQQKAQAECPTCSQDQHSEDRRG